VCDTDKFLTPAASRYGGDRRRSEWTYTSLRCHAATRTPLTCIRWSRAQHPRNDFFSVTSHIIEDDAEMKEIIIARHHLLNMWDQFLIFSLPDGQCLWNCEHWAPSGKKKERRPRERL
jgi:hypothetical protein